MSHQGTYDEAAPRPKMSPARKKRMAWLGLLGILTLSIVLPLASYSVYWLGNNAVAQDTGAAVNPRSNMWRAVEQGVGGYTSTGGPEAGILIAPGGVEWQQLRDGPVATYTPWLILGMFAIIVLYHLIHGKNKLDADSLSGRKIKRWSSLDRSVHWITAISFIALAITGTSMLIGKNFLIPLLGKAGFAWWAQASITIHNVVGPVFTLGVVLMVVLWIWHNFPTKVDVEWFKQGGGMFSQSHPPAGRMNGGEKVWFWVVAIVGLAVSVTGLIMLVPIYNLPVPSWLSWVPLIEGTRPQMQQANLVHAVLSLGWTALALGHVYIGTAGTEGAFEGMKTGYVSEEWAQQHHNIWADEAVANGKVVVLDDELQATAGVSARQATAQ
ncbi:MAG: formate dehydrogenase subunit gamma [Granulosicoccus sp.]